MVVWHVTSEIMLVINYLLEDEQVLSLGMLIHPKRIYNFCLLLMASLPSLVTPSGRFEMQCSSKFPSVKIPRFVSGGLTEIQEGVNGARNYSWFVRS